MISKDDYVISTGSLILVTGANGYIASHAVNVLLQNGYKVRGTVRTQKPWLDRYFAEKYGDGLFESIVIPELDNTILCREAMQGVSGVLHIAAELPFSSDPNAVIPWMKRAVVNLLEAAACVQSVKRFVLTSSSAAAFLPVRDAPGITVDENTWNEVSVKAAWDELTPPDERAYNVYAAAKTEQEQEAWRWVRERQPGFELNTIIPDANFGRILCPEIRGSSMASLRTLLHGDDSVPREYPPRWFVNVEDTARLHVIALLSPTVTGERIFAFAAQFNWTDVILILKKLRPNRTLIPEPPENEGRDLNEIVLSSRAEDLLREFFGQPGWIGLEKTIKEGIEDIN